MPSGFSVIRESCIATTVRNTTSSDLINYNLGTPNFWTRIYDAPNSGETSFFPATVGVMVAGQRGITLTVEQHTGPNYRMACAPRVKLDGIRPLKTFRTDRKRLYSKLK